MATKRRYTVFYRRKRNGKTNYKKRLALLLSRKPRFIVRVSTNNVIAQTASYKEDGDKIEASANGLDLRKHGWHYSLGNIPSAYLTGYLAGKMTMEKGFKEAVLDIGLRSAIKHTRIFAAVKGAIDAGLSIACDKDAFPDEKRILGSRHSDFTVNSRRSISKTLYH